MKLWKTISASLALCTLALTNPAAQSSLNPWFNDYLAYEGANQNDYVGDDDAAFLAWQESLLLRSYLNLYAATKNTAWLTKFTTHVNTMMGNLNNYDGDPYRDWTSARYSPPIVVNGLFASGVTGDTRPAAWARGATTTAANAFRTNTPGEYISSCNGNTWGVELVTDGISAQQFVQTVTYEANWHYQLSIYGKNSSNDVHGRVVVFDKTDNAELARAEVSTTGWANYTDDFQAPDGHEIEIRIEHMTVGPAGKSTYFDNVRVAPKYAYHILDGMIGIPMANFVRLVHQTPSLQIPTFTAPASTYRTFLETELIPKWQDSTGFYGDTWVDASATEGYYKEPTTRDVFENGASFNPLPYNQSFGLLEVQNVLFDVNGTAAYRNRAEQGATHFKNRLAIPPGETGYTWYYAGFAGSKVEDTSHSNVDVEFITEMHRSLSVFADDDMDRFAATLTDIMWNDSESAPELANHVDGTPGTYCDPNQFSRIMYGWVPYAQFDARAWTIAARQYDPVAAANHTEALTLSQIILWDPVKLTNQGFELPASGDPDLPARWSRLMSTDLTAFRDGANKTTGNWGLTLVSTGGNWQKLAQPWTDYEASTSYTVTFDGKADASGAAGRVWIYNKDTAATIAAYNFSNTSWQTHSFTFTSPSVDTTNVEIQLGHQVRTIVGGHTSFDNVSIKRTGEAW